MNFTDKYINKMLFYFIYVKIILENTQWTDFILSDCFHLKRTRESNPGCRKYENFFQL